MILKNTGACLGYVDVKSYNDNVCNEGRDPVHDKHNDDADQSTKKTQPQVVIAESGPET